MPSTVHFKEYKKWLAVTLIVCFVTIPFSSLTLLSFPKKVEATCAPIPAPTIYNPATVPVSEANDVSYANQKRNEQTIYYKTCVSNGIAIMIGKTILKALTRSIVQWINSGFKGNPSFIQNPTGFFTGVADKIAGKYIESIAPFLCSPFRLNIQLSLALSLYSPDDDISCTLTDVTNNIKDFADNTQNQAESWRNWFRITQNPSNNPYGAIAVAQGQMNVGISTAQGQYSQQLDWGRGFFSFEDCPSDSQHMSDNATGAHQVYDQNNQPVYGVQAGDNGCVTKTPGATIQDGLSTNLTSDMRGLEVAQDIDAIFSALVGQLMTQALGAAGLAGAGSYSSSRSSISIYGGKNDTLNIPLSGSCTADRFTSFVGQPVTWTAQISGADASSTYSWSGDEVPADSTGQSLTISDYTVGQKSASVTVTTTGQNPQTATFDCQPQINITNDPALMPDIPVQTSVSCTPNHQFAARNTNVTWTATMNNATSSATYSYFWEGDSINHFSTSTGPVNTLDRAYDRSGTRRITVHVTSSDDHTYTGECSVYIQPS